MALGWLLAALLALPAQAQEQGQFNSACFHGLVDADSPATLNPCDAQDLLNVESNLDGSAIIKRKGYQAFGNLSVTTAAVTGSHSFIDSSGNRLDIVCNDLGCSKSTNGNAFTLFLATATAGVTRWSFVDVGGVLYGANSRRDPIMKYDGTTRTSPVGIPLGSILELTQDRLVVGDISGNPNRVWYSSAGNYDAFTTGVNNEDSFWDEIGAPGDRIRGLKCLGGVCYIFKTSSITGCEVDTQYNTRCAVVSPTIGTTDPGSIVAAGSCLYFRSQDKNYWELCDRGLRQISRQIPNLVNSQSGGLGGGEQSNTQTTQADWNAGSQRPSSTWDTVTISGSIFPSSVTLVDTSSVNFSAGSLGVGLTTTTIPNSVQLSSAAYIIYNGDFSSGGTYWTCSPGGGAGNCTVTSNALTIQTSCPGGPTSSEKYLSIVASDGTTELYSTTQSADPTIITGKTLDLYALGLSTQSLRIKFRIASGAFDTSIISTTFTAISSITWEGSGTSGDCNVPTSVFSWNGIDNIRTNRYFPTVASSATPAAFHSRIFDTAFSTPTGGPFVVDLSSPPATTLAFSVRSSSSPNNDLWGAWTSISSGTRIAENKRYWQYVTTFTTTLGTATPRLDAAYLPAATTGQFITACIQPNTSISSWGSLVCGETKSGGGSLVYYATSAVSCATLPTTDPSAWQTSVTNNATVTIATNTAVKIGWRSLLTSATDQAQVDACILYWNEGTPTQPAWGVFDSVKNAVYWTATVNASSSTNRLLKYDRNLESWYPFDIRAQAPRVINNVLYFGGASSGTWYQFGSVDSDLGQPINAYWESKDIGSGSPFREKKFNTVSILSKNNGSGTMTGTYTYSNAETGSYTISLSTGSGILYSRSNYRLPQTSPQNFISIQVGNNSSTPFEVLGLGVGWTVLPWSVSGP